MRVNKLWILLGVFILVAMTCAMGLGRKSDKNGVKTIHPEIANIETYISTTGTVLPKNRLEVRPPVGGRVESMLVKEGDIVKSGQIVAWMSSTDRAALLDAARGKGEETLKYWQDVYKPIALVAPIDGEVIVATMQPGQTLTASDAVIVLSDKLIFRAQVDETDIGKISLGQEANASLDAYQGSKIKAVVDHIYYESKTVNNVTIYEVDLKTDDLPEFCRSGMNVTVDFRGPHKDNVLTLPVDAVQKGRDGSFVFVKVAETSKPVRRPVTTGLSNDSLIEVVSGLSESDDVIVRNQKFSLPKKGSGTNPFMPARRR